MISWPVIIAYDGDDELSYIASDAEWNCHPERSAMGCGLVDLMIDSAGRVYSMDNIEDGKVQPKATGQSISVNELVTLVQRHAALNNTCCVEKIGFRSIDEGLAIIASLVQDE